MGRGLVVDKQARVADQGLNTEPAPVISRCGRLRVALIAGCLVQGGAEKQLVYMARALHQAGVDIRIYSLTKGEYYEPALRALGVEPCWIGRNEHPLLRLAVLTAKLRGFRPHLVQSVFFFTNLYAGISGRLCHAITVGGSRSDLTYELKRTGAWAPWLLRLPRALITNTQAAKRNALALGLNPDAVCVVPNVIDLADFDACSAQVLPEAREAPMALAVGWLIAVKRFDRFLDALALARRSVPELRGMIVGDGPEKPGLERKANELGLVPPCLQFLGHRGDVPTLLGQADMLVACSDHEGFPNVLLEGMAARLPVVSTPAGDSGMVVKDGTTGYLVPFDDVERMAGCMVRLAASPGLRQQLGEAGRTRVEQYYSYEGLADRLLAAYRDIVRQQRRSDVLHLLPR